MLQVAVKVIRKSQVQSESTKFSRIQKEVDILRTMKHPNIVKLIDVLEANDHIGIVLEYASGGELFNYILRQRYLKEPEACRLFCQLVSGVSYLHDHGVVHRDLKLENLLLDRNRNIIITDFGFANQFDPRTPDHVMNGNPTASDLMETSCGSPCYAAPELVVSESKYRGRLVDIWSCGIILYAMLAGYLPYDDDPKNPDGENINMLYQYILSTPLTFPEYVHPVPRELLRMILVADPNKRFTLEQIKNHFWTRPYRAYFARRPLEVRNQIGNSVQARQVVSTSKIPALATKISATGAASAAIKSDFERNRRSVAVSVMPEESGVKIKALGAIQESQNSGNASRPRTRERLPAPMSKPRPTSFHPSFAAPTIASTIKQSDISGLSKAVNGDRSSRSARHEKRHSVFIWPDRPEYVQRSGSAAKSTRANAPGVFAPRASVIDTPWPESADKNSPNSNFLRGMRHKKAAASVTTDMFFNRLWGSPEASSTSRLPRYQEENQQSTARNLPARPLPPRPIKDLDQNIQQKHDKNECHQRGQNQDEQLEQQDGQDQRGSISGLSRFRQPSGTGPFSWSSTFGRHKHKETVVQAVKTGLTISNVQPTPISGHTRSSTMGSLASFLHKPMRGPSAKTGMTTSVTTASFNPDNTTRSHDQKQSATKKMFSFFSKKRHSRTTSTIEPISNSSRPQYGVSG